MTIIYGDTPEYDRDPALNEPDRAQPVAVDPSDQFIVITQRDGGDPDMTHCVLIERRDVRALIEALLRS